MKTLKRLMAQAAPRPWRVTTRARDGYPDCAVASADGLLIANLHPPVSPDEREAATALIVHCVNTYADLVEALRPFADLLAGDLDGVGGGTLVAPSMRVQLVKDARAALKLANNVKGSE